jgi:hypothetical protein
MKFPNSRKFFGGMRKRIYGIFGRKIGATPSKSKSKQPLISSMNMQGHLDKEQVHFCLECL